MNSKQASCRLHDLSNNLRIGAWRGWKWPPILRKPLSVSNTKLSVKFHQSGFHTRGIFPRGEWAWPVAGIESKTTRWFNSSRNVGIGNETRHHSHRSYFHHHESRWKQALLPIKSSKWEGIYSHFYSHFAILKKLKMRKSIGIIGSNWDW